MSKQLAFAINGPNNSWLGVSIFAGLIAFFSIMTFITDLCYKKFGKVSFTVSVIAIVIIVACCNYESIQNKKQVSMINNLAKIYPKMTVAKIDKNDYVFYFKSNVKHNNDNVIKNETGYEVSQNLDDDQLATVQKIKPQAILAQEIKEKQDTKKCIIKFSEGENDE